MSDGTSISAEPIPLPRGAGGVLVNAAIEGLGIIRQPHFLVRNSLYRKQLVRILPAWSAGEHAVYAAYPSRRYLPIKVRVLVDFLVERFNNYAVALR